MFKVFKLARVALKRRKLDRLSHDIAFLKAQNWQKAASLWPPMGVMALGWGLVIFGRLSYDSLIASLGEGVGGGVEMWANIVAIALMMRAVWCFETALAAPLEFVDQERYLGEEGRAARELAALERETA